ncbi:MAG TPA: hypothetical protein VL688_11820 [Verrucomicrobiae bacterium]|jgi:hypothetical protein|nr:hypothetical protein [Verrucomicrobiae bacterium]
MARHYLRVYQEFDLEDVEKHLLIMGDLSADCSACRALGIDGYTATSCPECGVPFKYITSRRIETHQGERFTTVRRIREKRPEMVFIDYGDFQKAVGQKKARDFFGS